MPGNTALVATFAHPVDVASMRLRHKAGECRRWLRRYNFPGHASMRLRHKAGECLPKQCRHYMTLKCFNEAPA